MSSYCVTAISARPTLSAAVIAKSAEVLAFICSVLVVILATLATIANRASVVKR
jgi:hypothetical protein